jgi:hypothetical protein
MVYYASVEKGHALRARKTCLEKVDSSGQTATIQAGKLWTVSAVEGNEALIRSRVAFPNEREATIRISLEQPRFSDNWEKA